MFLLYFGLTHFSELFQSLSAILNKMKFAIPAATASGSLAEPAPPAGSTLVWRALRSAPTCSGFSPVVAAETALTPPAPAASGAEGGAPVRGPPGVSGTRPEATSSRYFFTCSIPQKGEQYAILYDDYKLI